jgi:hypothetical protein
MLEVLGSRTNQHVGQFDHLIKNISPIRISRSKKSERKKSTLGEPWIVHIFIA